MLIDTFGRVATDLRVSLTDRCNLRCTYCMPEEGLRWLAKPDLLTDDEIVRLIRIAVTRRLTADGQIRTCLFAREESDLRGALRSGAPDEEIAGLWKRAMWGKKAGSSIDEPSFRQPDRPMSASGADAPAVEPTPRA
jgi:molybdenum cofactor biosynthesis enzyme MoaA